MKKHEKNEENCNFPKNEKLQFSSSFFHFFHLFIIFHHFCFQWQWCKNFPKNKQVQFSSSFFHFFIIFFIMFHHFLLFFINSTTGSKNDKNMKNKWKKNEENCNFPKKWKIAIFLEFFSFFSFFFHFFLIFFIFVSFFFHFFSFFFSFFYHFFIIFASSGAKIFQKMKNCNFPRIFSFFYHFFNHFSSFFIIFHQFHHRKQKW